MSLSKTICEAAIRVLESAAPDEKCALAHEVAAAWQAGDLAFDFSFEPPERPARPARPELLPPAKMPKRRKAGTDASRVALLHAIAHIEFNAIDLAFDAVARFGGQMPREFTDDWVRIGDDEARHFNMIRARLQDLGADYGDLPAHDGLWEAAMETAHAPAARMAVVPMVLEARGLDVTPGMIKSFQRDGDDKSAEILQVILDEEVAHVAAGVKWFAFLAKQDSEKPNEYFQLLVNRHFRGVLKPPFNDAARARAGFSVDFYGPLSVMHNI